MQVVGMSGCSEYNEGDREPKFWGEEGEKGTQEGGG
jgi:hypothetical protein